MSAYGTALTDWHAPVESEFAATIRGLLMAVDVMHVRRMRMGMDERFVSVWMGVRFTRRIIRAVRMLVVFVVHMRMRMRMSSLVGVGVLMMLGQMQPDANADKHASHP
jgi:hypothetical protein